MNISRRTVAIGLICVLALAACGGDSGPSRAEAIAAITSSVVPARYDAFATRAEQLTAATDAWCTDADGGALAAEVEATRLEWVSVSPFWFGPVMERRSRFIVDPTVTADQVSEIIEGSDPLDAATLRNLYGADQRGLGAIDQLVDIVGDGDPAERECEYAKASAGLVAEEAAALAAAWSDQGADFAADDEAANDAIESMVNEVLFGLVTLENDPDVAAATAKLAAMRWAILGESNASTGDVDGLAPLLDDEIVEQLATEFDAAADLDGDALMVLETTITTNVVSALGLSIQFSDADGDG